MEYDYADQLDFEWQSSIQNHLKAFSCQNDGKLYSYDKVLEKVFCPDSKVDPEVNYRDKERCEKCLMESLKFLLNRATAPTQIQVRFLLNIAKYTARDETCFINLNEKNLFVNVMYLSQPLSASTDKKTKILFLELLFSFLEHYSGIKWLVETKYWIEVYKVILEYQSMDEDVSNVGFKILTKLLEKAISIKTEYCCEVIQQIAGPLLNASNLVQTQTQPEVTECFHLVQELRPSISCLVEILERLLEKYSAAVLNCIMQLKIELASDAVAKITSDKAICLILDRIILILSFFKLSDILDGIKSMGEDPLAITGYLRILDNEINKGAMDLVFELNYYAFKYLKNISEKLPKCVVNGKNVDVETELVSLQLKPILLITNKLDSNILKKVDKDIIRKSHTSKMLQNLSLKTLTVGRRLREVLPTCPLDVYTNAVKFIIRSRHLYSKEQLSVSFECLIFSLQDSVNHLSTCRNTDEATETAVQAYVFEVLKAILLFIESFNLKWSDSVKILELAQIINGTVNAYNWPASIVVQSFKLLQEIISRRLSPSMSLLIDCAEDLNNIGPLLYQKCFTAEWEVRKAVLDVVYTIAVSANKSFPSFKALLTDVSLPSLISTMALNDDSTIVRATAFKCLHEIIIMEDMENILPRNPLINKVLDLLVTNVPATVKVEAIKLIITSYLDGDGLEDKVLVKVYKYLEHVAVTCPDGAVQIEALEFWCTIVRKHLSFQGWMDKTFPSVTFSKRIVCMTDKEVRKRLYKVLNELSVTGCLNVFEQLSRLENLPEEANAFLKSKIFRFYHIFQKHKVTSENMRLEAQEFLSMSPSVSSTMYLSPPNSVETAESDQVLEDIIDTALKIMPNNAEFMQDEDFHMLMDPEYSSRSSHQSPWPYVAQANHQLTPLEFVEFIYQKTVFFTSKGDCIDEFLETELYISK